MTTKHHLNPALCGLMATLLTGGCGVEFDSIGQLEGLRVLGVKKEPSVAQPGDTVEMQMVVHDTGDVEEKPRDLSYFWLGGCENPPGDSFSGCLAGFSQVTDELGDLFGADPSELDPEQLEELAAALQEAGLSFGFGETFRLPIPEDIISAKPPSPIPTKAPYGLSVTFFAVCAGQLRPDPNGETFPLACFDGETQLGSRDFVAGYTSTYVYLDQENTAPRITGMRVGGKLVPENLVCIGADCERPEPDPDRKCPSGAPRIERCGSNKMRQECPKVEVAVRVDPKSVDQDAPVSLGGEGAPEPMWVNYHTDSGSFTNDLALINDVTAGFRENPKTEFLAPEEPGPAFVWAAVRDSRGGFDWARTTICVR